MSSPSTSLRIDSVKTSREVTVELYHGIANRSECILSLRLRCQSHHISKSIKIRISSRACSCRLSPRRRGEDEGEGLDLQPRWVALMRPSPSPSPLARERRPCSRHVLPCTKKMTLVFGRARNDIYKIALNYSQIGQIYEVSQGNSH